MVIGRFGRFYRVVEDIAIAVLRDLGVQEGNDGLEALVRDSLSLGGGGRWSRLGGCRGAGVLFTAGRSASGACDCYELLSFEVNSVFMRSQTSVLFPGRRG